MSTGTWEPAMVGALGLAFAPTQRRGAARPDTLVAGKASSYPERLRGLAHPPPVLVARGMLAGAACALALVGAHGWRR